MRLLLAIFVSVFMTTGLMSKTLADTGAHDPDAIPHVVVTKGNNDIAQAWLIAPTQRYPHYVRGQQYEAGGLRVQLSGGNIITLMLDDQHVFEDRTARLADLDGDGRDEIIVVLTSLQHGAALAAYSIVNGEITLKAQTPFIGRPFRWLNPAGIADYTGDSQLDIALVQKPHLSKRLEFWTLKNGGFSLIAAFDNVSNHHNGSAFTQLSATADFNQDGVSDLAILSGNYRRLFLFKFSNNRLVEFGNFTLSAPGVGNFIINQLPSANQLLIPLGNGEKFELIF